MEKINHNELFDKIKKYENFGIGLHGIDERHTQGKSQVETARLIMDKGLKLGDYYNSINGNVISIGISGLEDQNIAERLYAYSYGSVQTNVIIAYPAIIENSRGEKLYLGYTRFVTYNQDQHCSLMDLACSQLGYIPKEFIFGYYTDCEDKLSRSTPIEEMTYEFEQNPDFCGEKQISDELFDKIEQNIKDCSLCDYSKRLSNYCIKAIDTMDIGDIVDLMRYRVKSAYCDSREKFFLESIYKDVSQRIVFKLQKKLDIVEVDEPEIVEIDD